MLDLNVDLISSDSSCEDVNNANSNNDTDRYKLMVIVEQDASRRSKLIEEEHSSGTSNSSIVSTEKDEEEEEEEDRQNQYRLPNNNVTDRNSSNNAKTSSFTFEIMKSDKKHYLQSPNSCFSENQLPPTEFITRQLFPVNGGDCDGGGGGESGELRLGVAASRPNPWLNLSFGECGGKEEMRILQQKQQQVRKSRRGPRSRSSQYRGVTFYRRTGRWESHIWWVVDYDIKFYI